MNYATFRGWLDGSVIDEEQWSTILAEDEDFDYANLGVGRTSDPPLPENEVQVYTSSTASNELPGDSDDEN